MSKKFILASRSPRRKELLTQYGFSFDIIESHIEERFQDHLTSSQNALAIAKVKALDVANKTKGIILAADTIVSVGKMILGKPKDMAHAKIMLQSLSGKLHSVITAFVIYNTQTKREYAKTVTTKLKFKKLTNEFINRYLKTQNPLDKAGAYAIQENHDTLVEHIEGSFTNVMGLPIEEVVEALRKFGILPHDNT
ncbi:MAG: septum formation protein Maf [Deltaproteobacteria bacterium GWA2_38_16]|nr:MAG: septum formation protein Maf [Deltaproteobacteria bacterium GWA2_38_16]OGQ02603.1 MAG: septum formation protein Maf [Deltaproteobacteria bacterium RIFCSPHIGHO2_02_FULL_38_15]OGQ33789.1 MAG: septum formation protein Maf [Deltaproteobacteria bacterium RIFCSPLOWO2_01_FULL_38_9]HBQ20303.1 septum formation protein Maf [Deltaproteobacteria bacterium]